MLSLLTLFYLHFIADFPLQGEFLANFKGKNDYILFSHCVIWSGSISIGLFILGLFAPWKLVMLLVGHFIIDRWKARKIDKTFSLTKDLYIDQFLHLIQIVICWYKF